jgi:simple sugar transport system ATP-binding protein
MPTQQTDQPPLIALRGITKTFPGVLANDQIDLDIYPAEIHALLGENGAGKSTLMKILFGFYRADAGEIQLNGKPIVIHAPRDARAARIGMVFQDLNLIPAFTVAENIALFLPDLKAVNRQRSTGASTNLETLRPGGHPQALVSRCPSANSKSRNPRYCSPTRCLF